MGYVEYQERLYNGGRSGWYRCDKSEIAAMLKNPVWRSQVVWLRVRVFPGGAAWFWSPSRGWSRWDMDAPPPSVVPPGCPF